MISLMKLTKYSAKIFQTALNDNGAKPKLKVDGLIGPKTLKAFVDFQFKANIQWTDDLEDSLESLGLKAEDRGGYFSLSKAKRNVKVEKERPQPIVEEIEPPKSSKVRKTIKLPKKRSECFKNKLWIDGARKGPNVVAKSAYKTKTGRPIGAVVHHTAGWNKPGAAINTLRRTKYGFNCIDIVQGVYQPKNLPLDKYGNHAGTSAAFLVGYGHTKSCSNKLVGYEINGGGLLKKGQKSKGQKTSEYYTWFGKLVPKSERRYVAKSTPFGGPRGWYEKFSLEQEQDLIDVLVWHCLNDKNFKWQNILGHHEVAGERFLGRWRKNDPGGSLSMDMEKLRQEVRKRVEAVLAK